VAIKTEVGAIGRNRGRPKRALDRDRFINTGLQAGASRMLAGRAVLTASLILPPQSMSFDELVELVGEGAQVMMLLLFGDICCDLIDIRFRHREGAVASSPCEFPRQKIVCVDPVGGTSLEQLNQVLDRNTSWKIDKGMNA